MPRKKTTKTKLSPAEKKDRKRLMDRARQAKKREDPDVRDKENAQKRARRAEDGEYRHALHVRENAQKRARREDPDVRDRLQVRDVNRKRTARNEKRDRRVDVSKGFVDDEHKTFHHWRDTEKGSDDMRDRDENGRHYLGKMDVRCGYCGAIGFRGELKTKGDDGDGNKVQNFGSLCCCKGKIGGIVDYELGDMLENLYTSPTDINALHFRANARVYNNSMAMSSLACEHGWRQRFHNNRCEGMLTSQGQLLRKMGPLTARDGERPKCIQAYFYGEDQATAYRMLNCKVSIPSKERETYKSVFKTLHRTLLNSGNKYLDSFMSVKDYIETKLKDKVWDVRLSITANASVEESIHRGRLNLPTQDEVAILFPDDITAQHKRNVILNYRAPAGSSGLRYIPDYHRMYDATQYPTLFVKGQDGWHLDLDDTCLQHTNFMIVDRMNDDKEVEVVTGPDGNISRVDGLTTNPILLGRKLGQQYIVDQYAKSEFARLRFVESHQTELCCEMYSGLQDAMGRDAQGSVGTRVVLPSSFTGGDRYMHQQYLDSMALFQRFGRPHFFITFTFNPEWREMKEALAMFGTGDQTVLDRPDLVARVFKLKKEQLIRDLTSECIFGRLKARTHSIEFQKRGFPHAHIIVWLDLDRHLTPEEIDKVICAEIPDEKYSDKFWKLHDNPIYEAVIKFMLHGPCGARNSKLSCMQDGHCRFNFPKMYQFETELSEDGYPVYRRRSPVDGGNTVIKFRNGERVQYTNADVVPYNKYLTWKYNCHINVEYCYSIKAIKYHIKYINKGSDLASMTVGSADGDSEDANNEARNEVAEYRTNRYISGGEGAWRLRGNEIAERKPTVSRLPLHLYNQQAVYFNPNDKDGTIERMEKCSRTKLTAFFELNGQDEFARTLLYREIPEHFTWDNSAKRWKRRARGWDDGIPEAIGRMYSIHPTKVELYSLRLLLNSVRGATSYSDINYYNGVQYETHQEAAIARGLVKSDAMWIACMREAHETETYIPRLRKLFVSILTKCEVGDHRKFFEACKDLMNEDFLRRYMRQSDRNQMEVEFEDGWTLEDFATNSCLAHLDKLLELEGHSLDDFHLPLANLDKEQVIQNSMLEEIIGEEGNLPPDKAKEFYEDNFPKLNSDQLYAFSTIKQLILEDNRDGLLIFLDAPGGTGKTFTLNVLISWIIMEGREVASSATSGIAANLLHLGRTAHNRYKLPINPTKDSTCNIPKQSDLAQLLRKMSLGIIDEGPMLDKLAYEALDRTLKGLAEPQDCNKKFGGKIILVSGDFRQLLPVIPKANPAKVVSHTLKNSVRLWDQDVMCLHLRENMRVKNEMAKRPNDFEFREQLEKHEQWLLDLGEGRLPCHGYDESDIIDIPPSMSKDSKEAVIDSVFEDFKEHIGDGEYYKSRVILAATNEIVNEVNNEMVRRIPGDLHTLESVDTVGDMDNQTSFPTEFLNSLSLSGLPEHELHLRVDSVVILLRNMDIKGGHCNGTRYLVKHIGEYRLVLHKLEAGPDDKDKVLILPRIPLRYNGVDLPFEICRLQFPVKLAFALTINRSQGQSVSKCGILLPKNVWTHGQIYVAFSRCGNPNKIHVWAEQEQFKHLFGGKLPEGKILVKNVVYREVVQ